MAAIDEGPLPLKMGDVVQVTNELHRWHLALVAVTAPMLWGVEGVIYVPMARGNGMQPETVYLEYGHFRKIGKGAIVPRPPEAGAPEGAAGAPGRASLWPSVSFLGWLRGSKKR